MRSNIQYNMYNFITSNPLLVSIIITLTVCGGILILSRMDPFIIIEADTTSIKYCVSRREITTIPLNDVSTKHLPQVCLGMLPSGDTAHVTALWTPQVRNIVSYKVRGDFLDIEASSLDAANMVNNVGILTFNDGKHCTLSDRVVFRMHRKPDVLPFLPVAGPAEIGEELKAMTLSALHTSTKKNHTLDYLYGGTVSVIGRTVMPFLSGRLYPRSDAVFTLQPGSRLSSGSVGQHGSFHHDAPSMYGTAEWKDRLLHVSLSTITNKLEIYRPGRSGEVEILGLGFLMQITSDPSVIIFILGVTCFCFIVQAILNLQSLAEHQSRLPKNIIPKENTNND